MDEEGSFYDYTPARADDAYTDESSEALSYAALQGTPTA